MKQPKRPTSTRRTQVPNHLPALTPLELEAVQQRLMASPSISKAGKAVVMQSLRAAANKDAESPDVVIKTLEREERANVMAAQEGYNRTLAAPLARGRTRLMAISDEQWQKAVDSGTEDQNGK